MNLDKKLGFRRVVMVGKVLEDCGDWNWSLRVEVMSDLTRWRDCFPAIVGDLQIKIWRLLNPNADAVCNFLLSKRVLPMGL